MKTYYLSASACEDLRRGGIAPIAYAFIEEKRDEYHWGYGAHSEPQVMIAEAIIRICSLAELEDLTEFRIIVSCPGITIYRDKFVWDWHKKQAFDKKANGNLWKEFQAVLLRRDVHILPANSTKEKAALCSADEYARGFVRNLARGKFAEAPDRFKTCGVFRTDEDKVPA